MRVLQNGRLIARLSAIQQKGKRLKARWLGPPPPFEPWEQLEPLLLESEDWLHRRDGWLLSVTPSSDGEDVLDVEFGSERAVASWHTRGERPNSLSSKRGGEDILIVDDDPEIREVVGAALLEQGWSVRTAAGGREGLAKADEQTPDVAIIDLMMPEIGGEQLCVTFRQNPKFLDMRILVLSAAEDTRLVAAACDADSAIVKPFTPELLIHEVRRLVGP